MRTRFPHRVLSALALVVSLGSCNLLPRSIDVREVREFPEYGGWMAVDSKGQVVPEHTAAQVREGKAKVWRPAPTREDALERVGSARRGAALLPLQGAIAIASLPVVTAGLLLTPMPKPDLEPAGMRIEHANLPVQVVDEHGAPISGAQLEMGSALMPVPSFLDERGLRSLGEPSLAWWRPSTALLEALHAHVETFLVEPVHLEWNSMDFDTLAKPGQRRPRTILKTDAEGRATLSCFVAIPEGNEAAALAYVSAWAPGYAPSVRMLEDVTSPPTLVLRAEPDRDTIRDACFRLGEANRALGQCIRGKGWIAPGKIDQGTLNQAAAVLRSVHEDASLPRWLHASAELALEEHLAFRIALCELAASAWVFPRDDEADDGVPHLQAELDRLRENEPPLARHLGDPATNPQVVAKDTARWLEACEELGMDPSEDPARTARQAELAAEGRNLIERLEALDPTQPPIESLRSILALHEGDRERAVTLSRFMDHPRYFAIFYGSLREPAAAPSEVPQPATSAPKP